MKFSDLFLKPSDDDKKKTPSPGKSNGSIFFKSDEEIERDREGRESIFFKDGLDSARVSSSYVNGDTVDFNDMNVAMREIESKMKSVGNILKSVDTKDYPDAGPEYDLYLKLLDQMEALKKQLLLADKSNEMQLKTKFNMFKKEFDRGIISVQSLCWLSEINSANASMKDLFENAFSDEQLDQIDDYDTYIVNISKNLPQCSTKYQRRLQNSLLEAEYRSTMLKYMREVYYGTSVSRNPFARYSPEKKNVFETYLQDDIKHLESSIVNLSRDKDKFIETGYVVEDKFEKLESLWTEMSSSIAKYTVNDFRIKEFFDTFGGGNDNLKKILEIRLSVNTILSYEQRASRDYLSLKAASYDRSASSTSYLDSGVRNGKKGGKKSGKKHPDYPDFDD